MWRKLIFGLDRCSRGRVYLEQSSKNGYEILLQHCKRERDLNPNTKGKASDWNFVSTHNQPLSILNESVAIRNVRERLLWGDDFKKNRPYLRKKVTEKEKQQQRRHRSSENAKPLTYV